MEKIPNHHPFLERMFHELNHLFWGTPWPWNPPMFPLNQSVRSSKLQDPHSSAVSRLWGPNRGPNTCEVRRKKRDPRPVEVSRKPRCSMYGIFTYIWVIYGVNVGTYSIHGASGKGGSLKKKSLENRILAEFDIIFHGFFLGYPTHDFGCVHATAPHRAAQIIEPQRGLVADS